MKALLSLLLFLSLASGASAQSFLMQPNDEALNQSLGPAILLIDFRHIGEQEPAVPLDYNGVAYGLVFAREGLRASFAIGSEEQVGRDLDLFDVSISGWGTFWFSPEEDATRFGLPVMLHSHYRRVRSEETAADDFTQLFEVTTFGLGAGVALAHDLGSDLQLRGRLTPAIGLATRSLGETAGYSPLLEGTLAFETGELTSGLGLRVAYQLLWQQWNIDASNLFPEADDSLLDYRDQQHTLTLGLRF